MSVLASEIFLGAKDCGVPPFTLVAHEIGGGSSFNSDASSFNELAVERRDEIRELVCVRKEKKYHSYLVGDNLCHLKNINL